MRKVLMALSMGVAFAASPAAANDGPLDTMGRVISILIQGPKHCTVMQADVDHAIAKTIESMNLFDFAEVDLRNSVERNWQYWDDGDWSYVGCDSVERFIAIYDEEKNKELDLKLAERARVKAEAEKQAAVARAEIEKQKAMDRAQRMAKRDAEESAQIAAGCKAKKSKAPEPSTSGALDKQSVDDFLRSLEPKSLEYRRKIVASSGC